MRKELADIINPLRESNLLKKKHIESWVGVGWLGMGLVGQASGWNSGIVTAPHLI